MLFLDFDGVICDSLAECLVSSWLAYYTLFKQERPVVVPLDLKQRFTALRPYVRYGEDYLLLQQLLAAGQQVGKQAEFDEQIAAAGRERMALFKTLLYQAREDLLRNEREFWLSLNPLYTHMQHSLKQLVHNDAVHIISTKRADLISEILNYQGIPFPPARIHFSGHREKGLVIRELMQSAGQSQAIFIDDQISHLEQIKDGRIEVYLAGWGYIQPEWLAQAGSIKCLTPAEAVDLLRRFT